jgi:hypothetical protein
MIIHFSQDVVLGNPRKFQKMRINKDPRPFIPASAYQILALIEGSMARSSR